MTNMRFRPMANVHGCTPGANMAAVFADGLRPCASNSPALLQLRKGTFDLVLLDLEMPRVGDSDILMWLRVTRSGYTEIRLLPYELS